MYLPAAARQAEEPEARGLIRAGGNPFGTCEPAAWAVTPNHATVTAREAAGRLQCFVELEQTRGDGSSGLLIEAARELALRMAYEDTVRVAELKIRSARFVRVHAEARVSDDQILEIAEYFHPRVQEIADASALGLLAARDPLGEASGRTPDAIGEGHQQHVGYRILVALCGRWTEAMASDFVAVRG
jgi:hypothetical protein